MFPTKVIIFCLLLISFSLYSSALQCYECAGTPEFCKSPVNRKNATCNPVNQNGCSKFKVNSTRVAYGCSANYYCEGFDSCEWCKDDLCNSADSIRSFLVPLVTAMVFIKLI